jgi:hypothetical protein
MPVQTFWAGANLMPYDLTISRIGAIAGFANQHVHRLSEEEILPAFKRQAKILSRSALFEEANEILRIAGRGKYVCDKTAVDDEVEPYDLFRMTDTGGAPRRKSDPAPLVGLLPSKRMLCEFSGMKWIVRTRASMTACALQPGLGLAKLWWTIEGIPKDTDSKKRPKEKDATRFLAHTRTMAAKAMPALYRAYRDALSETLDRKLPDFELGEERIQISLSDNDEMPVAALLDALYLDDILPSEIRAHDEPKLKDARDGLHEFETFVQHVAHLKMSIPDEAVSVEDQVPEMKGILFRHADTKQNLVTGFTRRSSTGSGYGLLSPEHMRERRSEDYLRTTSAARRISALLTTQEAAKIEAGRNSLRL